VFQTIARADTPEEVNYYRHGGSCRTSCGRCCSPTLRAALSIVGVPCPPEGGRLQNQEGSHASKIEPTRIDEGRSKRLRCSCGIWTRDAMLAPQNTNPTQQVEGVDMSHECTVADPEHYRLEFENEYVRVIRCRIPGAR